MYRKDNYKSGLGSVVGTDVTEHIKERDSSKTGAGASDPHDTHTLRQWGNQRTEVSFNTYELPTFPSGASSEFVEWIEDTDDNPDDGRVYFTSTDINGNPYENGFIKNWDLSWSNEHIEQPEAQPKAKGEGEARGTGTLASFTVGELRNSLAQLQQDALKFDAFGADAFTRSMNAAMTQLIQDELRRRDPLAGGAAQAPMAKAKAALPEFGPLGSAGVGALAGAMEVGQAFTYPLRWLGVDFSAQDAALELVKKTARNQPWVEDATNWAANGSAIAAYTAAGLEAIHAIGHALFPEPVATEVAKTAGQVFLPEEQTILAVVKDGKILAQSSDQVMSHAEFVARTIGTAPEGAEVVTIYKSKGLITVFRSWTFHGNAGPASLSTLETVLQFFY